jgi:hypothetical protein
MLRPTVSRLVCLGIKHPSGAYDRILITVWQLRVCWFGAPSLTRGRVCRLQLLLALYRAVILGSEPLGTRDHILLFQIRDFPFRRLLRLVGSRWRYSTPPPHGVLSLSLMLRPAVSRPVCLGIKHPFGAYDQILITCVTVTVLFLWDALSDERSGVSFICAAGSCQRSLSRVRVPWDLRPYFTVWDLRLPFSSSPTTRRVTVEVIDPGSTRASHPNSGSVLLL